VNATTNNFEIDVTAEVNYCLSRRHPKLGEFRNKWLRYWI